MDLKNLGIFSHLFFMLNALKFNMTEGEGGGAAEPQQDSPSNAGKTWDDPIQPAGAQDAANEPNNADDSGSQQAEEGKGNVSDLPQWAQDHIKGLRGESASHRTKFKDLEGRFGQLETGLKSALGVSDGEEISPEEQISELTSRGESLAMQNAVLSVALENGLGRDQAEYFGYLLQKEGESMEDDAELTEERYQELVTKAKGPSHGASSSDTSVDGAGTPAQDTGAGEVTVEQFGKMSYMDKVKLRQSNLNLYNKLFADARSKNLV